MIGSAATLILFLAISAPATAVHVVGKVEAHFQGKIQKVERYMQLSEGTRIVTAEGASLALRLTSGSLIRLTENTEVKIEQLHQGVPAAQRQERVKLVIGRVWTRVLDLLGGESHFEIHTKHAVAGARGTAFWVSSDQVRGDEFTVDQGAIEIRGQGQPGVLLSGAGAMARATPQGFTEPRRLPERDLDQLRQQVGGRAAAMIDDLRSGWKKNAHRKRNRRNRQRDFQAPESFTITPVEDIKGGTPRLRDHQKAILKIKLQAPEG